MEEDHAYATLAARLASFDAAVPIPAKKRVSTAKVAKAITWPHKTPAPAELAQAGFYYKPSAQSHDNAVCFLCERALDGWEGDDDPLQEHLKHSGDCAWAILMSTCQDSKDPSRMEDPTSETMVEVRRATFASRWPHDSKRGWTCKTEKMVEAGWYFAPTPESEDFVSCAYCKLSLDGWEPKDNPFDEHHRRSPECPFFFFAGTTAPKTARGKKSRTSKAARLSAQSNLLVEPERSSIPDLDDSIDTSTFSVLSTMSTAGNKKNTRGKRKATKAKNSQSAPAVELDSSVVEVPPPTQATKAPRGKKRTSDQISEDDRGRRGSTARPEHPSKRRNTRTRESVERDAESTLLYSSMEYMDVEAAPQKLAKKGRKRASSTARKVSTVSTAALRAGVPHGVPDDATIDAALEADLDRPLSDEEEALAVESEKPKKGKSKKAPAPTRGQKAMVEEEPHIEPEPEPIEKPNTQSEAAETYETDVETKSKGRKPRATKKAVPKKTACLERASMQSNVTVEIPPYLPADGSVLTTHTVEDDSGHETDASVASKSIVRKTSKRKVAVKGKGKKAGTRVVSKNIEVVIESQQENLEVEAFAVVAEPALSLDAAVEADPMEIDEKIAELTREIEEEEAATKKPGHSAKGTKGKTAKGKGKKGGIPQLSMPGAFSPLVLESTEPSFASAISPNSPGTRSNLQQTVSAEPADQGIDVDMEIRSPEEQSTPTPRRVAPPALPPRSPNRPTPTPVANRSALPRPSPSPTRSVQRNAAREIAVSPERSPSVQSSNAENAPPSSRPESIRPPLAPISPVKRVMLAPGTPTTSRRIGVGMMSPSKIGGGLKSEVAWTAVDVELAFEQKDEDQAAKENWFGVDGGLTSPEKGMSVEQWIYENARRAEEELRSEGERAVGVFEREGAKALRVLEGVFCQ